VIAIIKFIFIQKSGGSVLSAGKRQFSNGIRSSSIFAFNLLQNLKLILGCGEVLNLFFKNYYFKFYKFQVIKNLHEIDITY